MPSVDELELPEFDHTDPALRGDRWVQAAQEAMEEGWLARSPLATVVFDREACEAVLRSREAIFPGLEALALFGIESGPLFEEARDNIININGPDHSRLRGLVNPEFTPRAAARHRPFLRELSEELAAPLVGAGRVEAVSALCKPYASRAIAGVVGAPQADAPMIHDGAEWLQRQFDPHARAGERPQIEEKVAELYAWLRPMVEARRREPADDLISRLLDAEEAGDRLSQPELENLVLNVLVGGTDTGQSQLAQSLLLFARHPDQWDALRRDPGLAAAAAEESLRFTPGTPFTARLLTADLERSGVTFPAGSLLLVCSHTANRDPGAFERPDRFDITAPRSGARILTFGAGTHYCLGATLARAELEEALAALAGMVERIELAGEPELAAVSGVYAVERLELELAPA
ncbi:MAG: cytochrome P450 [Solirubrobacterales bacterium]